MAQQFKIKNLSNNKTFRFIIASSINSDMQQPALAFPLINANYSNRLLFRFQGQEKTITLNFVLVYTNEDFADGTHTSTVKTIDEQAAYLQDYIFTSDFDAEFEFWSYNASLARYPVQQGVIGNLRLPETVGPMNIIAGELVFQVGQVELLN